MFDKAVPDGVGPNSNVVAYSTICTHLGCSLEYRQTPDILACGCHSARSTPPARAWSSWVRPRPTFPNGHKSHNRQFDGYKA